MSKTTIAGVCGAVAVILLAVKNLFDGDPTTNPDWATVSLALSTLYGLFKAADATKTNGK